MTRKMRLIFRREKQRKSPEIIRFQDFSGGDKRDRTADLMTASHALSQLSYTPIGEGNYNRWWLEMQAFFQKCRK
jgi:hypothetical protein